MANQVSINVYRLNGTNIGPTAYGFPIQGCEFQPITGQTLTIAGITMNSVIKTPIGTEAIVAQTVAQLITAFT